MEEGQLIQISCAVTKGDDPITIQWYKDSQLLHSSSDFVITNVDSKLSILLMRSVAARHSGKYSCVASNPAGSANFSAEFNVQGNMHLSFLHVFCANNVYPSSQYFGADVMRFSLFSFFVLRGPKKNLSMSKFISPKTQL